MKVVKLLVASIFTLCIVTGCGNEIKEEGTLVEEGIKVNSNEGVIKDQTVEVFEMSNTSLVYENGTTTLETTVKNTSNQTQYLEEFKIKVTDKDGNEIITLTGFIGDHIDAGEEKVISSYCGEDLSSATNIEYTVIR